MRKPPLTTRLAAAPAVFALGAAAYASPLPPADVYLYVDRVASPAFNEPTYTQTGTWIEIPLFAADLSVGRPGNSGDTTDLATAALWTPSLTGAYTIQTHWITGPSGGPGSGSIDDAIYTLSDANGVTPYHINQQQFADQTLSGPNFFSANPSTPRPSGWHTLTTSANLNGASTVALTRGTITSGTYLQANAVRIAAGVDVVVDELAAATMLGSPSTFGRANSDGYSSFPNSPISGYAYVQTTSGSGVSIEYSLGGVVGQSDIWVSWGGHVGHTSNAVFTFDQDGDFVGTTGDQVVHTFNEQFLADQVTSAGGPSQGVWSGWAYFNQLSLTANSKIRVSAGNGSNDYITADAFRVVQVPEPASFALLAVGGVLVARRRRTQ